MRLYRGLNEAYRPEKVGVGMGRMFGTDFTDCPFTALQYARGRRGFVLVLDAVEGRTRVTEELWPDVRAKRLMVWGRFDHLVVATIPAKELRTHVRRKGMVSTSDDYKASVLKKALADWIANWRPSGN